MPCGVIKMFDETYSTLHCMYYTAVRHPSKAANRMKYRQAASEFQTSAINKYAPFETAPQARFKYSSVRAPTYMCIGYFGNKKPNYKIRYIHTIGKFPLDQTTIRESGLYLILHT